jgi:hypothetical protein
VCSSSRPTINTKTVDCVCVGVPLLKKVFQGDPCFFSLSTEVIVLCIFNGVTFAYPFGIKVRDYKCLYFLKEMHTFVF